MHYLFIFKIFFNFSSLVIELPSLLTIFSEQKPLKSNDHGNNHLHLSFSYFFSLHFLLHFSSWLFYRCNFYRAYRICIRILNFSYSSLFGIFYTFLLTVLSIFAVLTIELLLLFSFSVLLFGQCLQFFHI
jgi:hypothetical protein